MWIPTASANAQQANMYMRTVDKFNSQLHISCLMTASGTKFILLHEKSYEDQIKQFFNEMYELFVKALMNPFFDPEKAIEIPQFDDSVALISKRCF